MNKWLAGNGYWCTACNATGRGEPRDRFEYESGAYAQFYDACPICQGEGRIAATPQQIIARKVPLTPGPRILTCLGQRIEYGRKP